jgi:hypothetical protein
MEPNYNFLKNTFLSNPIDYDKLKEDNIVITYDNEKKYDVSFIIPVRGRIKFLKPMFKSFSTSAEKSGLSISFTVVEHSVNPEHSHFCKQNKINYIWIKSEEKQTFNKCLAMNIGAIFGPKAKYFLFHDLDCLMQSDFFTNLVYNVFKKNCEAIQCFHGRRVLYLNDDLTNKVIQEQLDIDTLKLGMPGIGLPNVVGAPGGSILVSKDVFFQVGGYDPELFNANAPEDIFFWDKVNEVSKMEISDNPEIDLFHMNHPVTYNDNPRVNEMLVLHKSFVTATPEKRKEFVTLKQETIKKYFYE